MHRDWLLKSGALFSNRTGSALQPVALPQHAPDAGRAHCDKLGIDHHTRQSSVAAVSLERFLCPSPPGARNSISSSSSPPLSAPSATAPPSSSPSAPWSPSARCSLTQGRWPGRPSICHSARSASPSPAPHVYGLAHTRLPLETLKTDHGLRQLCGWDHVGQLPHESTFSRAFGEFADSQLSTLAHEALIRATRADRLVGHIASDGSAIEASERFIEAKPRKAPKAKGKKKRKKPLLTKELDMLEDVPTACDVGGKKGSNVCVFWWR